MAILSSVPATIAASGSLSGEADLYPGILVGVWMPAVWTAAPITFQTLSPDGSTWLELYNYPGAEVTLNVAAGQYITIDPTQWKGVTAVKVRSGTSASPVAQSAQAIVNLVTRQMVA
jgi:hypothetical protein